MSIFSVSSAQIAAQELTTSEINDRLTAIAGDTSLDPATRQEVADRLNEAKDILEVRSQRAAQIAAYQGMAQNLDALMSQMDQRQAKLENEIEALAPDASVSTLRTELALLDAERLSLLDALSALRAQNVELIGRAAAIAEEIVTARDAVARLEGAGLSERDGPVSLIEEANRTFEQASLLERRSAIDDFENEAGTIPARQSLTAARIRLVEADIARHDAMIERRRVRLGESTLGRAETAIDSAKADITDVKEAYPLLLEVASDNLELAIQLRDGVVRRTMLETQIAQTERRFVAVEQSAETAKLVLAAGRLSEETAALLQTVRATIPDTADINMALFQNEKERVAIQLQLVLWLDQLRAANDAAATQRKFVARPSLSGDVSEDAQEALNDKANHLFDVRQSLLETLIEGARHEIDLSSKHELTLAQLAQYTDDLSKLLDRRFLWLRTSDRVNRSWLRQIPSGIVWALSPSAWTNVIKALIDEAVAKPAATSFLVLVLLGLVGLRPKLTRALASLAQNVGHVGRDTYWTTPLAMVVTALLALPVPLAIGMTGWLLLQEANETPAFTHAFARTTMLLSPILFVFCLFAEMCRPEGLFEKHFGWPDQARMKLRRNLRWFTPLETTAIFLFGLAFFANEPSIWYGVDVVAFVIASIGLAILTYQFLRPHSGIVSELKMNSAMSAFVKIIFPLAVMEPLLVGVLPFFGFFDTATELQFKVLQSGALALAGAVAYGLSARMFMVGNRRLALSAAKQKRTKREAARAQEIEAEGSGKPKTPQSDEEIADAKEISEQVRSLLQLIAAAAVMIGLWLLWSPLFPALGIASDVALWTRSATVNGTEILEAVTLLDLATAVVILAGGVVAARNVGGLLQASVFEPFSLDSGSRYAAASITRYVIIAVAIIWGLSILGADWSRLQWIIAALGVGLGFGLQEIVANFVSGLIILFERPIRVGDVVTIGELRGTVSSIRIRATTITDFDSRQVILPNKTIITENVTNWTLDDDVTRLLLKLGVAYGSNVDVVRKLILDTVSQHPDVLDKPPPTVFFMRYGDSALEFEVRLFVAKPVKRLPITHELNTAINNILKENGVEIPFPQTDVHVSVPENISVRRPSKTAKDI